MGLLPLLLLHARDLPPSNMPSPLPCRSSAPIGSRPQTPACGPWLTVCGSACWGSCMGLSWSVWRLSWRTLMQ
jgi:hypothetical protein